MFFSCSVRIVRMSFLFFSSSFVTFFFGLVFSQSQAITITCLVLHYKTNAYETDLQTNILASGTFVGYTIILIGVFAGNKIRKLVYYGCLCGLRASFRLTVPRSREQFSLFHRWTHFMCPPSQPKIKLEMRMPRKKRITVACLRHTIVNREIMNTAAYPNYSQVDLMRTFPLFTIRQTAFTIYFFRCNS